MICIKTKLYLILIMVLLAIYCHAGPRGLPAPSHDDATAPDDAGPRFVARHVYVGLAILIPAIIVLTVVASALPLDYNE
ncbi:unnamed protein product [Rotaria sp. Silwood1]|nr:unnamed protein product [Rotaria sp. Silwood1]CAF1617937.1 unnamed protein product [Rotaria sp. Silwood1]